jgi:hypothetical protein
VKLPGPDVSWDRTARQSRDGGESAAVLYRFRTRVAIEKRQSTNTVKTWRKKRRFMENFHLLTHVRTTHEPVFSLAPIGERVGVRVSRGDATEVVHGKLSTPAIGHRFVRCCRRGQRSAMFLPKGGS